MARGGISDERYGGSYTWVWSVALCNCEVVSSVGMFLGFRAVPMGVYETPDWTKFIPLI
jgi:hypothetical protein